MACAKETLSKKQIRTLINMMRSRKYIVYTEPFKLNIVAIRRSETDPNHFDDELNVFFKNTLGEWVGYKYAITTDPSTTYLLKGGIGEFQGKDATAILPHGQYVDTFKIGIHRKSYTALTQAKKICVYRDYNRDSVLDFNVTDMNCGFFGINIHRAKRGVADDGKGNTKVIGQYSAGCQVFQNSYCFDEFMEMAQKQKELYGNKFTYTLFDFSLRNKFLLKRGLFIGGLALGGVLIGVGIFLNKKFRR
jgi:hypothetical protein